MPPSQRSVFDRRKRLTAAAVRSPALLAAPPDRTRCLAFSYSSWVKAPESCRRFSFSISSAIMIGSCVTNWGAPNGSKCIIRAILHSAKLRGAPQDSHTLATCTPSAAQNPATSGEVPLSRNGGRLSRFVLHSAIRPPPPTPLPTRKKLFLKNSRGLGKKTLSETGSTTTSTSKQN